MDLCNELNRRVESKNDMKNTIGLVRSVKRYKEEPLDK
jgi:hypothetical protein